MIRVEPSAAWVVEVVRLMVRAGRSSADVLAFLVAVAPFVDAAES